MVAATDDFNIVKIVRVDGWQADATVVHLASENFISEEIVAKKTSVAVGEIVRLSHGDINKIAKKNVHAVVLLSDIVDVLSVLVNSV